jgi:hypothetical protein
MSISGGASSRTPTQDQLDELDALMQRMLQLPVDPCEAGENPLVENSREQEIDPSRGLARQEQAATEGQEVDIGLRASDFEERRAKTENLLHTPFGSSGTDSLSPGTVKVTLAADTDANASEPPAAPDRAERGRRFRPLLLINAVFESATSPLGSTGAWLRSDSGRNIIGILGILAAVWSLIWLLWGSMSWTW